MSLDRDSEDARGLPGLRGGLLFVPVRTGPAGCAARLFRTPLGDRTAVGFTTAHRLAGVLGGDARWVVLAEPAIRALVAPLGVTALTVDPYLVSPSAGLSPTPPLPTHICRDHESAGPRAGLS